MLNRRQFLGHSLLLPFLFTSKDSMAQQEFEEYLQQQSQGTAAMHNEWLNYKDRYHTAFKQYQTQLSKVWSETQVSTEKIWITYSDDLNIRRTFNFETNEVRIEITGAELTKAKISQERIAEEVNKTLNASIQNAYQADPLLTQSLGKQAPNSQQVISPTNQKDIKAGVKNSDIHLKKTKKGDVVVVTVPLATAAIGKRERTYLPIVNAESQRWKLQPALVLAIMETESAFNPMARSHIPAFGLMQIVPSSAGRDATRHAWKKETLLTGAQLFQPATNIELGCAYLNLLDTRYLAAVNHPHSRLLCVISAYNTGAGNVAKAFSGTTNVTTAAARINALSPNQVHQHLLKQLPYHETRQYLQRVTERMARYQG